MKNWEIHTYSPTEKEAWNRLNKKASNGSFLFDRAYLAYHSSRFEDASILVKQRGEVIAVLPAHRVDNTLYSHKGLSYGALVISSAVSLSDYLAIWQAIIAHFAQLGFQYLELKMIPAIYTDGDNGKLGYAMHQLQAQIRDVALFSYSDRARAKWNYARRYSYKKAANNGLMVYYSGDFKRFWNELLQPLLRAKYQTNPVHSAEEIEDLARKFPYEIQLVLVEYQGELVAGTVLFCQANCIKVQYIASSEAGRKLAALDFLFGELLQNFRTEVPFWDWGSSHGASTAEFQHGLLQWKASWGAITQTQTTYRIPIALAH